MKIIGMAMLGGLLLAAAAGAETTLESPEMVRFSSPFGVVAYTHKVHEAMARSCELCHHEGVEEGKCKICHGVDPEAPEAKEAFHRLCKGCHMVKKGPVDCSGCHQR